MSTAVNKRRVPLIAWAGVVIGILFALFIYPAPLETLRPHFAGTCRAIAMDASAEDLSIDRARGVAYLSYLDRTQSTAGARQPGGTVMLVDLNVAQPRVRAALVTNPPNFRPLGISLYVPQQGPRRLFVINRAVSGPHSIEIFEQTTTGAFASVESIRDPLLLSPNAIVAVGPKQFYVANDTGLEGPIARLLELLFRRARSTVVYYDGDHMNIAATRMQMATGIAASADARTVYVSEAAGRRLHIFDRNGDTGALRTREVVALRTTPDNLNVADDGSVWIAAHPRMLAILRNLSDASVRSPTQVLKFTPTASGDARVSEIYLNGGDEISAGSVGAAHGKQLLIGSVTDRKLLLCGPPK